MRVGTRSLRFYICSLVGLVVVGAALLRFQFNQPQGPHFPLKVTPEFVRFISFGRWPALVDFFWIMTLERLGESHPVLEEVYEFYRLGVELDPYFYELYDQGAINFSYYFESADYALDIIDRGIRVYESGKVPQKFWTHPYSLYIYRAYVNAFMKNDWRSAKADYLKASQIPGSPEYLKRMATWLNGNEGELVLAKNVLKLLIQNTTDPMQKKAYENKLKALEGRMRS